MSWTFCVMSWTFCKRHYFTFSQFCYLSVHILMSSVLIYIHFSILPHVSIFLLALISMFLPVSVSIFLPVSIAIFLPDSIFLPVSTFLSVSNFCHFNQIVGTDTSCSICDKSPRSSSEKCDRLVVPWYLRDSTWNKREWNQSEV